MSNTVKNSVSRHMTVLNTLTKWACHTLLNLQKLSQIYKALKTLNLLLT